MDTLIPGNFYQIAKGNNLPKIGFWTLKGVGNSGIFPKGLYY